MIEKPILFSGPMVRAILDGRKTQTRRVVMEGGGVKAPAHPARNPPSPIVVQDYAGFGHYVYAGCPYTSNRLWVRETWRTVERDGIDGVEYAADGAFAPIADTREAADAWVDAHENGKHGEKWRPSIFLRRWASRLTLAVESIRVERLQDISEEDARAEGCSAGAAPGEAYDRDTASTWRIGAGSYRRGYRDLWDSINSKRGGRAWADNPWVWVVTFRKDTV